MNKVYFKGVVVGSTIIAYGKKFRKTSDALTKGRKLSRCKPNAVELSSNHKCVIGDNVLVEVLNDNDDCFEFLKGSLID